MAKGYTIPVMRRSDGVTWALIEYNGEPVAEVGVTDEGATLARPVQHSSEDDQDHAIKALATVQRLKAVGE